PGLKRVDFRTTKPLPTYLIALAVGPLDVVDWVDLPANAVRDRPLPLRGVATAGKGGQLEFALENTDPIVRYLENYFGVEYPYAKLDLIASPEMGTGAMENAGAIMYGDAGILMADNASAEQRRRFGSVHAHELAHQWFGNLVTPKWWDDTWLNESFASWMGFKAAAAWRPEYQLDVITLVQALAAMNLDSRIAARQIRQPVENNLQIASSFDAITYLKGGGVLSMFESYLGEEGFRNGLRKHMQRFRFSVADVEDFMESLAMGSGRPDVVPAFRSFIDQPGVPLADVSMSCGPSGARLSVSQSRYLPIGSKGNPNQLWKLPLCVRYDDNGKLAKHCTLVTSAQTRLDLTQKTCPDFVMPNADGAGYYRFALNGDGWAALMNNFQRLNQKEALSAADSLSAAYQADRLSTAALFDGITRIATSEYPQVAMAPKSELILLHDKVAPDSARPALQSYMRAVYRPRLNELESADLQNMSEAKKIERALFRTSLIEFLALYANDRELQAQLADQARRYIRMDAGEDDASLDESAVDPALSAIALKAGVLKLGAPFAEVLIQRLVASNDAKFRAEAAAALGNTDNPALGDRVRELLLDERLRAREPTTLAFELAKRPSQRRATFDWFKANHEAFIGRLSHFAYRWLPRLGAGFCSIEDRNEVESFFKPLVATMQGADRTLAEVVEGIELCAALKSTKGDEITAWLTEAR
ncbi:MAG TPA: M1 family peptidase, partial [Chromatiales bacterium]|nr:M1 family peptidase [Chromatiales bacterium]